MASVLIQKKKQGQDLALPRTTDKRTILRMIRLLEKSILKGRRADKFLSARVL